MYRVVTTVRINSDDFLGVLSLLGLDIFTANIPNFSLKTKAVKFLFTLIPVLSTHVYPLAHSKLSMIDQAEKWSGNLQNF